MTGNNLLLRNTKEKKTKNDILRERLTSMIKTDRVYLRTDVFLFHSSVAKFRLMFFDSLAIFENYGSNISKSRIDDSPEDENEDEETAEEKFIRLESERLEAENLILY